MKNNFSLFIASLILFFSLTHSHSYYAQTSTEDAEITSNPSFANNDADLSTVSSLTVYPGEILSLSYRRVAEEIPEFYFGRKRLAAIAEGETWRVFVGIATDMIPGQYVITVTQPDKSNEPVTFVVKPSRNALSSTKDIKRSSNFILNRLQSRQKKDASSFKLPNLPWANLTPTLPFAYPAKGQWSQNFGELQVTNSNDLKRLSHVQLVTTEPQPVLSPADAICLEIIEKEGVYSVWLDHGMGLFSHISGLKNITIEEQDKIVAGSVISNIVDSKTTVPHTIQWRMLFNGILVNPHSAVALK